MLTKRKSVFPGFSFNHTLSRNPRANGGFGVMDGSPRDVSDALQINISCAFQTQITGMTAFSSVAHLWKVSVRIRIILILIV